MKYLVLAIVLALSFAVAFASQSKSEVYGRISCPEKVKIIRNQLRYGSSNVRAQVEKQFSGRDVEAVLQGVTSGQPDNIICSKVSAEEDEVVILFDFKHLACITAVNAIKDKVAEGVNVQDIVKRYFGDAVAQIVVSEINKRSDADTMCSYVLRAKEDVSALSEVAAEATAEFDFKMFACNAALDAVREAIKNNPTSKVEAIISKYFGAQAAAIAASEISKYTSNEFICSKIVKVQEDEVAILSETESTSELDLTRFACVTAVNVIKEKVLKDKTVKLESLAAKYFGGAVAAIVATEINKYSDTDYICSQVFKTQEEEEEILSASHFDFKKIACIAGVDAIKEKLLKNPEAQIQAIVEKYFGGAVAALVSSEINKYNADYLCSKVIKLADEDTLQDSLPLAMAEVEIDTLSASESESEFDLKKFACLAAVSAIREQLQKPEANLDKLVTKYFGNEFASLVSSEIQKYTDPEYICNEIVKLEDNEVQSVQVMSESESNFDFKQFACIAAVDAIKEKVLKDKTVKLESLAAKYFGGAVAAIVATEINKYSSSDYICSKVVKLSEHKVELQDSLAVAVAEVEIDTLSASESESESEYIDVFKRFFCVTAVNAIKKQLLQEPGSEIITVVSKYFGPNVAAFVSSEIQKYTDVNFICSKVEISQEDIDELSRVAEGRRYTRPLQQVTDELSRVAAGRRYTRPLQEATDELSRVAAGRRYTRPLQEATDELSRVAAGRRYTRPLQQVTDELSRVAAGRRYTRPLQEDTDVVKRVVPGVDRRR